mmetsp:Transcript_31634/g.78300  ORF Transcript_31634/g.78300 Transcript_31634/m.78300 type:complete len:228 (+) Transcript_31634:1510-2193(+)
MPHVLRGLDGRVAHEVDHLGVRAHVLGRHLAHPGGHGRGEEAGLPLGVRAPAKDCAHVVGEAHVEHLVRLVQRGEADAVQLERLPLHVVLDAAGRADEHIHARAQRRDLRAHGRAAVHAEQRDGGRDRLDLPAHLLRQLARRRHHEADRAVAARLSRRVLALVLVDQLDHRQRKGQRLAHSRARTADQVGAVEDHVERGRLDGEERRHAAAAQRCERVRAQPEVGER